MTFKSREDALDMLEAVRREWVDAARSWAMSHAADGRIITINDVRRDGPPIPEGIDPRVCGCVFRTDDWIQCGYTASPRKLSHRRPVARFRRADIPPRRTLQQKRILALQHANPVILGIIDRLLGLAGPPPESHDPGKPYSREDQPQ